MGCFTISQNGMHALEGDHISIKNKATGKTVANGYYNNYGWTETVIRYCDWFSYSQLLSEDKDPEELIREYPVKIGFIFKEARERFFNRKLSSEQMDEFVLRYLKFERFTGRDEDCVGCQGILRWHNHNEEDHVDE